jgi:hypothetical protein
MKHFQPSFVAVRPPRYAQSAVAGLVTFAAVALPAYRPALGDLAPERSATTISQSCPLTRIGTQLVRCDLLTGAGVPAPYWVAQR